MGPVTEAERTAFRYQQKGKAKLERKKKYRGNRQKAKRQSKKWRMRNPGKVMRYQRKVKRNPDKYRLRKRAAEDHQIFEFWDESKDEGGSVLEINEDTVETTLGSYDTADFLGEVMMVDESDEDELIRMIDQAMEYSEEFELTAAVVEKYLGL